MTRRRLLVALLSAPLVAVAAFYIYGSSETDVCFAQFDTPAIAEKAAAEAREAGFETEVEVRNKHTSVEFRDGVYDRFLPIVRAHDGRLTHPGGCTARSRFFD